MISAHVLSLYHVLDAKKGSNLQICDKNLSWVETWGILKFKGSLPSITKKKDGMSEVFLLVTKSVVAGILGASPS